jgi:hypothetical protein
MPIRSRSWTSAENQGSLERRLAAKKKIGGDDHRH